MVKEIWLLKKDGQVLCAFEDEKTAEIKMKHHKADEMFSMLLFETADLFSPVIHKSE